ncbi:MAG: hypothetical protein MI861_14550, partial [Pirellulales bacterium]|nr:hypothetical protein [Pirellulales bacterium]
MGELGEQDWMRFVSSHRLTVHAEGHSGVGVGFQIRCLQFVEIVGAQFVHGVVQPIKANGQAELRGVAKARQ